MKILEINIFNYRKGGSEAVYFNTIKMLKENGHEVYQFALKHPQNDPSSFEEFFPESVNTRKGILAPFSNLVYYFYNFEVEKKLEQMLIGLKPDIAQVHLMWGAFSISLLKVLKKHNIPVVLTIHEYRLVCPAYTFRNGKGEVCEKCGGKSYYKCVTNKCCKNSYLLSSIMASEMYFRNCFYTVSNYISGLIYVSSFAKHIDEKYMPSLKDKPNIVLYNTSDSVDIHIENKSKRYYLFYGRLSREKGLVTLLKAFKQCPEQQLKIVGTGPEEASLKLFVMDNNISNVSFMGYKTGDELKQVVKHAFFVIVPSEWYENNPMTIVESYSLGVPVIGARIGGIPEIIEDGKTGYIFEKEDINGLSDLVIQSSMLSDLDYQVLQNHALSFAENNFNQNTYYTRLIKFFENVTSKNNN